MTSNKIFKEGVAIRNDRFLLKVSKNRLEAWLEITEPEETSPPPDLSLLKEELTRQGVVYGLLPQTELIPGQGGSFLVAKGTPAENGQDAVIEHRITMAAKATMPKKKARGRKDEVDHRELHHLINVQKGQLLAEIRPPTTGKQGKDVLGEVIKTKDGKDFPLKGGQGTGLSEDGRQLLAKINGEYRLTDGRIEIISEHLVQGDVDMKVGNIAFGGVLLTIKGKVLPGFKVRCLGDIDIHGEVNNGLVEAGGELTVKRSIVGPHTRVKCRADISAASIEEGSTVQSSGGGLTVGSHIVQGRVHVADDIVAMAGKGVIRGGQYMAGGSLYTKELGSDGEAVTEVTVGIRPEVPLKRIKLQQGNRIWLDRRDKVDRCIDEFERLQKRRHGKLDAEQETILAQLREAGAIIDRQLAGLKELEEEIHRELDHFFPQIVCISGRLFPGVTIRIGNGVRFISEPEKGVVVYQDEETRQILSRPLTPEDKPDVAKKGARKERL